MPIPQPTSTLLPPFDPTWRSWAGLHGGYLVAHAAAAAGPWGRRARSVHAWFLGPAPAGAPLELRHDTVHEGRTGTFLRGEVLDEARRYLHFSIMAGAAGEGIDYRRESSPTVRQPDDCPDFEFPRELVPFAEHLDVRPANDALPLAGGAEAELVAWVRVRDAALDGGQRTLVLLDALPPALYATMTEPIAIPTVTMSSHLASAAHEASPDDWFLVRIRTESASDGWATESSQVWSGDGVLLGSSIQERRLLA